MYTKKDKTLFKFSIEKKIDMFNLLKNQKNKLKNYNFQKFIWKLQN